MELKPAAQVDPLVVARQAGQLVALALGGFVLCLLSAILVFWLFYAKHQFTGDGYDWYFGSGADADTFKLWFWVSYSAYIVIAIASTLLLGRLLRLPLVVSVLVAIVVVAWLSWQLLLPLAGFNACESIYNFPIDRQTCFIN